MSQSAAARTTSDGTDLADYELQLKRENAMNNTEMNIPHNI